jgi:hypothetical protein
MLSLLVGLSATGAGWAHHFVLLIGYAILMGRFLYGLPRIGPRRAPCPALPGLPALRPVRPLATLAPPRRLPALAAPRALPALAPPPAFPALTPPR